MGFTCRGAGDADEGDKGEDEGEHGHVEPLPFDARFAVTGEVGHVHGEGAKVAYNLIYVSMCFRRGISR